MIPKALTTLLALKAVSEYGHKYILLNNSQSFLRTRLFTIYDGRLMIYKNLILKYSLNEVEHNIRICSIRIITP